MIEVNYPTGEEDLEDVFIPSKSFKVTSMSALFADDGVGAKGQVKREEASGQTYQILGKALTLSLGTESGYETGQLDEHFLAKIFKLAVSNLNVERISYSVHTFLRLMDDW